MAAAEKNSVAQAKAKTARSQRLYWVLGTVAGAAVLFTFYFSGYVSSQQAYYNERAFRLLSSMADKFALHVRIADNVLRASANFKNAGEANDYIHKVLHSKIEDRDFTITNWHKPDETAAPNRQGLLTLFEPETANSFRIRADYREIARVAKNKKDTKTQKSTGKSKGADDTKEIAPSEKPCAGTPTDITLCATINFDPLVRPSFHDLEEGFFDDVLVVDSDGNVLYQESLQGIRIQNISGLRFSQDNAGSGGLPFKPSSQSAPASGANAPSFASLTQTSGHATIELANSEYDLFFQPLSVSLQRDKQERKLVLCALRTSKHTHSQALALPYNYLLWSILILLSLFTLGWPMLKFYYMSPKERLQSRQILYLLASVLLATGLVTLIALNASYYLTSEETSRRELIRLSKQINNNFTDELTKAMSTLDTLSVNPSVLKLVGDVNNGNKADFLKYHADLCKGCEVSYPYFRYFFLAGADGSQLVKFTVNHETTPWTNVKDEPFFHPVIDGELSEFKLGGGIRKMRIDPLFSPNTGEFLVILTAPWLPADKATKDLAAPTTDLKPKDLSANASKLKVLAIKAESLVNPVLPTGFGFAVVAPDGKVFFHSSAVRNMNEDFTKEARGNVSLQALLAQGSTGILDINYLGTKKKIWVTPLEAAIHPRLTLVVFKDSADTTTMNMAVVIVFSVLVMCYTIIPVFLVVGSHVLRRKEYPLEVIWPNSALKSHYIHLVIANSALSIAYFERYVCYGLTRALLTVLGVALVAAAYPFIECRKKRPRLANTLVVIALVATSGISLVLGVAVLFAVYAFYPSAKQAIDQRLDRLSVKFTYTLAASSLLVILVMVPGAGFFKVSYDFAHRLFVQSRQLDLAEHLEQRREAIKDYYSHLEAVPSFEKGRLDETWDRYDKLFLNCPVISQDSPKRLERNLAEKGILYLTGYFPLNPFAAQLEALARTRKDVPGSTWEVVDIDVFGPGTCRPNVLASSGMRLTPSSDDKEPGEAKEAIFTPVPVWPALDWRVRLGLTLAIIGLARWIHIVPRRLFLFDVEGLPPLGELRPHKDKSAPGFAPNILLIGHPKSGKRETLNKLGYSRILDIAEMATTGKWEVPGDCGDAVALNHFEFGIDDAAINQEKLNLLEKLMHVQHKKKIALASTLDPLYYLNAGCPETVVSGEKKDVANAVHVLDRWAVVLATFQKVSIEDSASKDLYMQAQARRDKCSDHDDFLKFVDEVVEECAPTAQLQNIGAAILADYQNCRGLLREQLICELLDRADSYYRVLWATCTPTERLVLYQLAQDGWANPKNKLAIQQLKRRKLIIIPAQVSDSPSWPGDFAASTLEGPVGIRIMNASFRQFVRDVQQRDEIEAWQREGDQSVWRFLQLSLGILGVAAGAWLLYSQQQFFNTVVAYVGALGAAAGVVFKLVSDLRGKSSASGGGSQ